MYRVVLILLIVSFVVTSCAGPATEEPTPEPIDLLSQAATNIRAMKSFRMLVEQTGADYLIPTEFGEVLFRRANADYLAPDIMQATVRVLLSGLPLDIDIFAKGDNQWVRGVWTNHTWWNAVFAPGFNPEKLIAQESGFQAALKALLDIALVGKEELIDGTPVYHLTGSANGPDVSALVVGLIQATGKVAVDVYIHRELFVPVRFVIVQTDTATTEQPEPTTWSVEVYDFNTDIQLNEPEVSTNVPEVTEPASS